jgi:hypothetical protein
MGTRNRYAPGHPCCEVMPPPPCDDCTVDPGDSLPVTFNGMGNAYCDCSALGATFVLGRYIYTMHPCFWWGQHIAPCLSYYGLSITYQILASTQMLPTSNGWGVQVTFSLGGSYAPFWMETLGYVYWKWESGSWDPFDCSAQRSLTYWKSTILNPAKFPCADYATSTCQVN